MRIFLGWVDICGQISDFRDAYQKLGHKTFTYVIHPASQGRVSAYNLVLYPNWMCHPKNKLAVLTRKFYTVFFAWFIKWIVLLYASFRYDVFHFIWVIEPSTKFYFWWLKKLNKKIIVHFAGSDFRWYPIWFQEMEVKKLDALEKEPIFSNLKAKKADFESKIRYVRICEKFVDVMVAYPLSAQLLLKPYYNFLLPVDLSFFSEYHVRKNEKPIVALGISQADKDSKRLLDKIEAFQAESEIEFELVILRNMTYQEVVNWLQKCDIFMYSPYLPGTGKFGMEAMAAGAVTMCGYDHEWFKYPPNSPVVHIQGNTAIDKMKYYLQHPEERRDLSRRSFDFAKKYADSVWIAEELLKKVAQNDAHRVYDYYPTFFREEARLNPATDGENCFEVANKWNKYVSTEDWYAKGVPSGSRDGLEF